MSGVDEPFLARKKGPRSKAKEQPVRSVFDSIDYREERRRWRQERRDRLGYGSGRDEEDHAVQADE